MSKPVVLADLPPCAPERNFFYCPHPMQMTDEELEANFPRERRIEFLREFARLAQPLQPTREAQPFAELSTK